MGGSSSWTPIGASTCSCVCVCVCVYVRVDGVDVCVFMCLCVYVCVCKYTNLTPTFFRCKSRRSSIPVICQVSRSVNGQSMSQSLGKDAFVHAFVHACTGKQPIEYRKHTHTHKHKNTKRTEGGVGVIVGEEQGINGPDPLSREVPVLLFFCRIYTSQRGRTCERGRIFPSSSTPHTRRLLHTITPNDQSNPSLST
jgi:hypothetical protein